MTINWKKALLWARSRSADRAKGAAMAASFHAPKMLEGVAPKEVVVAMDSAYQGGYDYANLAFGGAGMCLSHEAFMGYPRLAMLAQKAEFRMLSEKPAEAMTRKWIEFKTKTPRAVELEKLLKHYNIRELFQEIAKQNGLFGRAQ